MNAVAYSTLTALLVIMAHAPHAKGQSNVARAPSMPKVNRTEFKRVLTSQLAELHSQLQLLQRSSNQTNQGYGPSPGSLNEVAQKVDAMLLTAMPGFVGETIDIVQNAHPALSLGSAFADVSDYGLLAIIREASEQAKEAVQTLPSTFLKSLGTIETISYELSPAAKVIEHFKTYSGCRDAFQRGETKNGVYTMKIHRHPTFRAWCDFDNDGAWTVIMRRFDGNVDFCKPWNSYVDGFGSLWGEHWLGLRSIRQLSQGYLRLSLFMEDIDGRSNWMNYTGFYISGADDNYRLSLYGFSGTTNFDAFSYHSGYQFSTWDRGVDANGGTGCARSTCSGWWYRNCGYLLPTRRYDGSSLSIDSYMSVYMSPWYRLRTFVMRVGI